MTLPTHSPWGASSYYRWKACPASIRLCKGMESPSSEYAQRGTLAHEMAADILTSKPVRSLAECGLEEEDLEAVYTYTDHVNDLRSQPDVDSYIETRFDLSSYYPGLYGTADCVLYSHKDKKLTVIDYKHGQGIPVEVEHNSQLMYYGLGALHTYKFPIERVELTIVQPRCLHPLGPVRTWETTPLDLIDFAADLIADAVKTEDPDAPLAAGDHCRFCPAQAICPELSKRALTAAQQAFAPADMIHYDPLKLGQALDVLSMLESWVKAVREFAYREAQSGRVPPGWKLVEKRARRKWRDNVTHEMLAGKLGLPTVAHLVELKLRSPAQVEKLLDKDKRKILAEFFSAESSGYTLVPESDARQPVPDAIEAAFGVIDG